jgi:hypothetical protein
MLSKNEGFLASSPCLPGDHHSGLGIEFRVKNPPEIMMLRLYLG